MNRKIGLLVMLLTAFCMQMFAQSFNVMYQIALKNPGNPAVTHQLQNQNGTLRANKNLPVDLKTQIQKDGEDYKLTVTLSAKERIYFNLGMSIQTDFATAESDFYLPGFWYHKNLRSPDSAPSFHTSNSWNVREDRLSSPLSGVFDSKSGKSLSVLRQIDGYDETLTTHQEGEVILSGKTSLGYLGFDNSRVRAAITFGYPYIETPKRYIRKLTLVNPIYTFAKLEKGESLTLSWLVCEGHDNNYGQFIAQTWRKCIDRLNPQPVKALYSPDEMKAQLSNYFRKSYVDKYDLKYNSGISIRCDDCLPTDHVQLGFCGRVLLNAFNALEYGRQINDESLVKIGNEIFDSWLKYGFTAKGYFKEDMHIAGGIPTDQDIVHSIRQQSEAVYAVLHYLAYE